MYRRNVLGSLLVSVAVGFSFMAGAIPALADLEQEDSFDPTSLYLGNTGPVRLDDVSSVLGAVFSRLDREVTVYPTENYLYYRFHTQGKEVWGNLRLSPEDRDDGVLHVGYYEYSERLTGIHDANVQYRAMDADDGVRILKVDPFQYEVSFEGRSVTFHLNRVSQEPPTSFLLGPGEQFVFNLHDESNYQFSLLYNEETKSFQYVLNEGFRPIREPLKVGPHVVVDRVSTFAFYVDSEHQDRKILIGTHETNLQRNSYYDGPFDQLADNYVDEHSPLSEYIQEAYAYTRGRIDRYGVFQDMVGARVAIMPYYGYRDPLQMVDVVRQCETLGTGPRVYACVALDFQKSFDSSMARGAPDPSHDGEDGGSAAKDPGASPMQAGHQQGVTPPPHYQGVTFGPHNRGVTFPPVHIQDVTFPPHYQGVTYFGGGQAHFREVTFPPHYTGVTFPPGHFDFVTFPPHYTGVTFPPHHLTGITFPPHYTGVTYFDGGLAHFTGVTFPPHRPGTTFPPSHFRGITFIHIRFITWPP